METEAVTGVEPEATTVETQAVTGVETEATTVDTEATTVATGDERLPLSLSHSR